MRLGVFGRVLTDVLVQVWWQVLEMLEWVSMSSSEEWRKGGGNMWYTTIFVWPLTRSTSKGPSSETPSLIVRVTTKPHEKMSTPFLPSSVLTHLPLLKGMSFKQPFPSRKPRPYRKVSTGLNLILPNRNFEGATISNPRQMKLLPSKEFVSVRGFPGWRLRAERDYEGHLSLSLWYIGEIRSFHPDSLFG